MSIWEYADQASALEVDMYGVETECRFCSTDLLHANHLTPRGPLSWDRMAIGMCPQCGWWTAHRSQRSDDDGYECFDSHYASFGILKKLDLADLSLPLGEVRDFLTARYRDRHQIHPKIFEDVVASVFADVGYRSEVTAYTGDGGIDVLLRDDAGREVGVQVKRYRRSIEAEQIRAFLGALLVNGVTQGIFVSTSRFRKGAVAAAARARELGRPIELIDATRFYAGLGIAQRKANRSVEELMEIVRPNLKLVHSTHGVAYGPGRVGKRSPDRIDR